MIEKDLRPIVADWLKNKGYYVAHEVILSGYCDLTGCKWAERIGRRKPPMLEIIAIELKIANIVGVLDQARINCSVADYSYAAMPLEKCESMRLATRQKFRSKGVGLLGIDSRVNVIIEAKKNKIEHDPDVCRRLWSFKLRHKNQEMPE